MFSEYFFFNGYLTLTGIINFYSLPIRTQAVFYMCSEYKALLNQEKKRFTVKIVKRQVASAC